MTLARLLFWSRGLALSLFLAGHVVALLCLFGPSHQPRSPLEDLLADSLPATQIGLLTILLFLLPKNALGWFGRAACVAIGLGVGYFVTASLYDFDCWHERQILAWQTATIFAGCSLTSGLRRLSTRSKILGAGSEQFSLGGLLALMFLSACGVWGAMTLRDSQPLPADWDSIYMSPPIAKELARPATGITLGLACLLAAWPALSRRAWLKGPVAAVAIAVLGGGMSWALRRETDAVLIVAWLLLVAGLLAANLLALRAILPFQSPATSPPGGLPIHSDRSASRVKNRLLGVVS